MSLARKPPPGNVRRVVFSGNNERGIVTNKAGRVVQFESFTERKLILLLDRDSTIKDYGSQPHTFEFKDDIGKTHKYTPDFMVWKYDGTVDICEVTLKSRRERFDIKRREEAGHLLCQKRGWQYQVFTEEILPTGTELANLLHLWQFRPSAYDNAQIGESIRQILWELDELSLPNLLARLESEGCSATTSLATIYHKLWHNQLQTDLTSKLLTIAARTSNPTKTLMLQLNQTGCND